MPPKHDCPKCRHEWFGSIDKCPKCGFPLEKYNQAQMCFLSRHANSLDTQDADMLADMRALQKEFGLLPKEKKSLLQILKIKK